MNDHLLYLSTVPFESALRIPCLPESHACHPLHGHSYYARIRAKLPLGWQGFIGGETVALTQALTQGVAPLDYRLLNDHMTNPTDENLARWLWKRLAIPGLESVGIQSTRQTGADLDGLDSAHIWRKFRFEAAHQLPNVGPGHPCGRMHGHGFEVILHSNQTLEGREMGVDFDRLAELWQPLQIQLHNHCLNDIPGLENPTSEVLAAWIWQQIKPQLDELSWVTVYETTTAGCNYDGKRFRIWKERRFESALQLQKAPGSDVRRQLHGHSYLVRLHLCAPLDAVMGWTVDYGEVKEIFQPLYKLLDHRQLNNLPGIADADLSSILHWIKANMADKLPQLDRIDLYESPGCGATLCWGEEGPILPDLG
ncbi:MAG: 6-carboxytetrahydropterin synthase [Magnetococcales bacterium]|nr:6-carboxytetrahydropterin synthase [Magnetococcales bacterium]